MIVADTHALLWWVNGNSELSSIAQFRMNEGPVGIAAISCWEVAFLVERRRIAIPDAVEWFAEVFEQPDVLLLPLTLEIAAIAAGLSQAMRDPADCLIAATALHHGVALVTKDERIRSVGVVETIW